LLPRDDDGNDDERECIYNNRCKTNKAKRI